MFDFRTFDCVRLVKRLGEFDYVRSPNPIQNNGTTEVRLNSITERSIGYVGTRNMPFQRTVTEQVGTKLFPDTVL